MASKFIQKYPIPNDFPLILKNFSREILRDQPANIIQYAAKYFQALEKGQTFKYQSAYNVSRTDRKYQLEYQPQKAEDMVKKDLRINNPLSSISEKQMQKLNRVVDYLYNKYDKDASGTFESKEIRAIVKDLYKEGYLNFQPNQFMIQEFMTKIDKNANGKIERTEIILFIRKLIN